jgi:Dolichol kinase
MSESKVLLQFCIQQNRLLERLDHFLHSVEVSYRELKDRHGGKLERKAEKLARELEAFSLLLQKSAFAPQQLQPRFEKILLQARQLKVSLTLRWRERKLEENSALLAALGEKLQAFRSELKELDLKETLGHMADAVLIDRFDDLAHIRDIQWPRKIWHALAAVAIVSIYLFMPNSTRSKFIVFGIFTAYATICDVIRLMWPKFNTLVVRDLRKFMRKREISGLNSMTFYALSTFTVCLLFPKGIAILAILYLGFGDPAASIVGIKWGRHKIGNRFTWEGSLAFFAVCFLLSLLYPWLAPGFSGNLLAFALLGGFSGMVSEWCSFRLDDNLVVPLVSAVLLTLSLSFLS